MRGLVSRLLRRGGTEQRSADFCGYGPTLAGPLVNARIVENLATVTACVGAVSSAMASLPAYCYRRTPAGRVEATDHPAAMLLHRPNARQTWADWIEWTVSQVLLHGNALSAIEHDPAGRVTALVPVPWGNVQPMMLPSGRIAFDVTQYTVLWGGTGLPRRFLDTEVFWLRDRSDDGILGRSRLSRAPEVLGTALALQEFAGSMWRNQVTPSGAFRTDRVLPQKDYDALREQITEAYTGSFNARRPLLLTGNLQFQPFSVSPEDAEVLASRRFTVEELCRLFQVPPPLVQDYSHSTFTNAETAARWFAQFSLAPWARKIEAEFQRSVFGAGSPDLALEIDLSGLMRGDYAARWQANVAAVQAGILDADEVREAEGWNPRGRAAAPPAPPAA